MKIEKDDYMTKETYKKPINSFKMELVKGARLVGDYDFPMLAPSTGLATRAIPFDKASKTKDRNQWVHFYIDDHRFEGIWSDPNRYLPMLKSYDGVISTDFSVYTNLPLSMQIWNTYRNRALAFWLQSNGIDVIPNVQWGDERSYAFCFDGIPKGSTVAISTNGCISSKHDRFYFKKGLHKMIEAVKPAAIINYSNMPDDIFAPVIAQGQKIIGIENYYDTLRRKKVSVNG